MYGATVSFDHGDMYANNAWYIVQVLLKGLLAGELASANPCPDYLEALEADIVEVSSRDEVGTYFAESISATITIS